MTTNVDNKNIYENGYACVRRNDENQSYDVYSSKDGVLDKPNNEMVLDSSHSAWDSLGMPEVDPNDRWFKLIYRNGNVFVCDEDDSYCLMSFQDGTFHRETYYEYNPEGRAAAHEDCDERAMDFEPDDESFLIALDKAKARCRHLNREIKREISHGSNAMKATTPTQRDIQVHTQSIGCATLYLGDARDILPALGTGAINMIWTDPPYSYNNADRRDFLSRREYIMEDDAATKLKPIANNDAESARALIDMMLREAVRLLPPTGTVACCSGGGSDDMFTWLAQRMNTEGLSFYHALIWDKCAPSIGWRYRWQYETVIVGHRKCGKIGWNERSQPLSNVIRATKPRSKYHPNIKPLALIEPMLYAHTVSDDVVLDPFMGTGSTGVAAIQQGRRFIGIESDPDYFTNACVRIEKAQKQLKIVA